MICKYCYRPTDYAGTGRIPDYCSNSCRQAAYRLRKIRFCRQRKSASAITLALRNAAGTGIYKQVDCFDL